MRYEQNAATISSSIAPPSGQNSNVSIEWAEPNLRIRRTDKPNGTPPPVYRSKKTKRKMKRPQNKNLQYNNSAFNDDGEIPLPQTTQNFGKPTESQWI